MSLLVVGSIALDSIFTPFGETADAPGGSAVSMSLTMSSMSALVFSVQYTSSMLLIVSAVMLTWLSAALAGGSWAPRIHGGKLLLP